MSARDLPADLMRVVHAAGRIWFQLPKSEAQGRRAALNSVDFSPAIAWKIRYAVRDHQQEFREQLLRLLESTGAAKAGIVIDVPGMAYEERKVTLSGDMTRALLRVVTDYPSPFCEQLDACCSLARMWVAEHSPMSNLSNDQAR